MKIAAVLSRKGPVFETVAHDSSLSAAVSLMHSKAIGSVGVVDGSTGEILGLISQQELTAAIARYGTDVLNQPVTLAMRQPILSCACEDNAAEVMQFMTRERSRHAIVRTFAGAVAGLVSLGDLVAALLEEAQLEAGVLRDLARSRVLAASGWR